MLPGMHQYLLEAVGIAGHFFHNGGDLYKVGPRPDDVGNFGCWDFQQDPSLTAVLPIQESSYFLEDNVNILHRISSQRRRIYASFIVMVVMRTSFQVAEFFFVIPAQKRDVGKQLIGIIRVTLIVIHTHLEVHVLAQFGPDLEIKLMWGELSRLNYSDLVA